jgi:hypothetical protein
VRSLAHSCLFWSDICAEGECTSAALTGSVCASLEAGSKYIAREVEARMRTRTRRSIAPTRNSIVYCMSAVGLRERGVGKSVQRYRELRAPVVLHRRTPPFAGVKRDEGLYYHFAALPSSCRARGALAFSLFLCLLFYSREYPAKPSHSCSLKHTCLRSLTLPSPLSRVATSIFEDAWARRPSSAHPIPSLGCIRGEGGCG